jgi:hypothetical protein
LVEVERVDVNGRDINGSTALHEACFHAKYSCIVGYLIEHGANVNAKGHNLYTHGGETTPLHVACGFGASYEVVQLLLDKGANVNAKADGESISPLLLACKRDAKLSVIQLLLQRGAKVGQRDDQDRTLLHHVISSAPFRNEEGRMKIVEILLQHGGIDVNARERFGNTVLHRVCWDGCIDLARLLIHHGASVFAENHLHLNANAFDEALYSHHLDLARTLLAECRRADYFRDVESRINNSYFKRLLTRRDRRQYCFDCKGTWHKQLMGFFEKEDSHFVLTLAVGASSSLGDDNMAVRMNPTLDKVQREKADEVLNLLEATPIHQLAYAVLGYLTPFDIWTREECLVFS